MSLWNEKELDEYNKRKLQQLREKIARLDEIVKNCEIKEVVFTKYCGDCWFKFDCLRK